MLQKIYIKENEITKLQRRCLEAPIGFNSPSPEVKGGYLYSFAKPSLTTGLLRSVGFRPVVLCGPWSG